MKKFDDILQSVEASCRERHIPMLGPEKAKFLKQIVRKVQPNIMIECGTAIGYSGLWIAHELHAIGTGKLITIEIDPERASEAQSNFTQAGVNHLVDSRIGDARNVLNDIDVAVDLLNEDATEPRARAPQPQSHGNNITGSDGATEPFTVVGSRRRWLAPLARPPPLATSTRTHLAVSVPAMTTPATTTPATMM